MARTASEATRAVPCSVVLLTVAGRERQDAMTATATFVSEDPPLVTVSVAKHIVSHDLIDEAGSFVLNVASEGQVDLAAKLGSTHGKDVDKFKKFGLETEPAANVSSPILRGSYASLECKVMTSFTAATYAVYLAEVVGFRVDASRRPVVWHGGKFYPVG